MCLTDWIFLQTHATVCEYLVFNEFRLNLHITLAKYFELQVCWQLQARCVAISMIRSKLGLSPQRRSLQTISPTEDLLQEIHSRGIITYSIRRTRHCGHHPRLEQCEKHCHNLINGQAFNKYGITTKYVSRYRSRKFGSTSTLM